VRLRLFRTRIGDATDAPVSRRVDSVTMKTSYSVVWREGQGPLARGKLEFLSKQLRLDGMGPTSTASREIDYGDLAGVRVGRAAADRIDGRPSLVLERRGAGPLAIASVVEPGMVGELVERLTALQHAGAERRTAVVVPLVPGSSEAVQALLADGPPFDPAALGLDRHLVFLTPDEVVFVFESWLGASVLEPMLAEPGLWERAAAWQPYLAGPPRLAQGVYSWTRPSVAADPSLLPPGGLRNGDAGFDF
jgi:hypothetical protein